MVFGFVKVAPLQGVTSNKDPSKRVKVPAFLLAGLAGAKLVYVVTDSIKRVQARALQRPCGQ